MAERKVNIALIAYFGVGPDGGRVSSYGQLNQTVEVHESDLARFDELNGSNEDAAVVPEVPAPEPLDHGAGGPVGDFERPERDEGVEADVNEDGPLPEPDESAPKADWVAYAEQEGVDPTGKTKRELITELTGD